MGYYYYKRQRGQNIAILGGGYTSKVLSYSPIAYWPLNETSGSTAVCRVNTAQNGTYTGVTLGQTQTDSAGVSFICPFFDGANDYVDVYSATLAAAFNGLQGSFLYWFRVYNSGVWTDSTFRDVYYIAVDGNNTIRNLRLVPNNAIQFTYKAGGTAESITKNPMTTTDWAMIVQTWDKTANEYKVYVNAVQEGGTEAIAGTWSGSLGADITLIGATSKVPANPWHGYVAHPAIFDKVLVQADITDLYNTQV